MKLKIKEGRSRPSPRLKPGAKATPINWKEVAAYLSKFKQETARLKVDEKEEQPIWQVQEALYHLRELLVSLHLVTHPEFNDFYNIVKKKAKLAASP